MSHLSFYVSIGKIDIHDILERKAIEEISDYFKENPNSSLTDAKTNLNDNFSYEEIKMVFAWI